MGSPEKIQIERLLQPIADEKPSGDDPRADDSPESPYRKLKDGRQRVRQAERQLARGNSPDVDIAAEWHALGQGCEEFLVNQAKDLEVTVWLIESLVREHGFTGLRDGLRLASELVDRFWDSLYPPEDEQDGMALRVAGLRGLFGGESPGTLNTPIGSTPLTAGADGGAYSYFDYQLAEDLESVKEPERRARRIEQGALTMEAFETAARSTEPEHFDRVLADIAASKEELERLSTLLDERCPPLPDGDHVSPPVMHVREILRSCDQTIRTYYEPIEETGEETAGGEEAVTAEGGLNINSEIRSREEAFRILLRVADYFKRTEPHSPLSYALEQSVRWGRLPLPKLWSELIPSDADRERVFKLVGIPQESESDRNDQT